jgi:hypothetical protein
MGQYSEKQGSAFLHKIAKGYTGHSGINGLNKASVPYTEHHAGKHSREPKNIRYFFKAAKNNAAE